MFINFTGCPATFIDSPDNQTLTTAAITSGKNIRFTGYEFIIISLDVSAMNFLYIKLFC